ncbi:MAG: hypothetical protein ACRELB_22625, partial [Polyangiaceae bacterium]
MIANRDDQNARFNFAPCSPSAPRAARTLRLGLSVAVLALVATGAACGGATASPAGNASDAGTDAKGGPTTTPVDGGGQVADAGSKSDAATP